MEKKIQIEGMMCQHCVAHVEKALTALGGVSAAQADLEGKCATVTLSAPVSDEELKGGGHRRRLRGGGHPVKADHDQITRLLKTARGQIDGILKMVEEDRYCLDVSNQLMATQSILKKANRMVLKAHMNSRVRQAVVSGDPEEKLNELALLLDELADWRQKRKVCKAILSFLHLSCPPA
ncbi:MAG: metal-sensing transcriptional repressor [Oscillospiraceae bacterium]